MNLANASSRSPTNRGNCRPQIHHHLRVHRQAYQTRHVDPLAKELLSRRQGFGSVLIDWLSLSQDVAANKLPFIVTSATDTSDNPPQSVFENTWCLWDTGAQTSFMVTSQLGVAVRDNKTEGNAILDINFSGVNQTIGSLTHFRPQLPNGVSFIILGQHALLNRLQYQIQLVLVNPQLSQLFPEAYGQIELVTWSDPVNDQLVPL
ncbi:hypothetical protein BJV77DRAFT_1017048 [Russula vinacea]|nr:hypothetical protein BJV77DRAFT_1017048 [Russula vinacea]